MHTALATPLRARLEGRVSLPVVGAWTIPFAAVLYLGLRGGGYDSVVHDQVGIALWWFVLLGAAVGALSAARLSRAALVALALLGAFTVWTALGMGWASSSERAAVEVARVATYLGALTLALTTLSRNLRRPAVNG